MRKIQFLPLGLGVLLAAVFMSCGAKKDAGQNSGSALEQIENSAKQMSQAAENMTKSLNSDRKPVPPVHFKVLMSFLPTTMEGMAGQKPDGETASMGEWTFSKAHVAFNSEDGSRSVNVEIFDYAYISMLYAPFTMLLNMKYSRESSDGYERSVKIAEYPAYEKWEDASKDGEVNVLVGERFIVTVRTQGLPDGSAKRIVESLDLKKLSGQKAV